MESVISAPDDEWVTYIAKMWLLGSQVSKETIGEEMDGSLGDLDRLQRILDTGQASVTNTQELQSLGIVFGKVFVNETPNYDWWVVEDDHGKDACIRYKETSLLAFPQTMISRRVEEGGDVDVTELFDGLRGRLEAFRRENYSDA